MMKLAEGVATMDPTIKVCRAFLIGKLTPVVYRDCRGSSLASAMPRNLGRKQMTRYQQEVVASLVINRAN
jgi:hypothetical protein